MTITNSQLNDAIKRMEERMVKVENRMDKNDDEIKSMKISIEKMNTTLNDVIASIKAARWILALIGLIIGPVATVVLAHLWK